MHLVFGKNFRTLSGAQSLMALGCMEHRGGCSADNDSGDGAGLLTNVPWELFKRDLPDLKEAHTGCAACLTRPAMSALCCLPCSSLASQEACNEHRHFSARRGQQSC